jgi:aryl-alcohol dehydrogenase-like predicted oxidoreductase
VAFSVLDRALERGLSWVDTSEVYPTPFDARTQGDSERLIGRWLAGRGGDARDRIRISTKMAGPGTDQPWIRGPLRAIGRAALRLAVEGCLGRLGVERLDVFTLHWPYPDPPEQASPPHDGLHEAERETIAALSELRDEGVVAGVGVCNLPPERLADFASALSYLKTSWTQAPVNLLTPISDAERETRARHGIALVGYSPLAHGVLSGRYLTRGPISGDRLHRHGFLRRYRDRHAVIEAFDVLARDSGMTLPELAMRHAAHHPGVAGILIGPGRVDQLEGAVALAGDPLDASLEAAVAEIQARFLNTGTVSAGHAG